MMLAGNTVRKNKGGLAFVADGQVVAELALPVAGLMSTESAESVAAKMQALNDALKAHGVAEDIGIFMTLAFVSLPVIPKLRLNTYGIIDVAQQKVVSRFFLIGDNKNTAGDRPEWSVSGHLQKIYPMLVAKAVRKGRTQTEVDEIIGWLTELQRPAN